MDDKASCRLLTNIVLLDEYLLGASLTKADGRTTFVVCLELKVPSTYFYVGISIRMSLPK